MKMETQEIAPAGGDRHPGGHTVLGDPYQDYRGMLEVFLHLCAAFSLLILPSHTPALAYFMF